jgi:hypothetical protein
MKRIAQATRIFMAMLREIFDEAGYARFLQRAKMQSSAAAYAAFSRDREAEENRCPKCC